ncbi:hypothetical protein DMB37_01845 [Nocardia sp. CS682]|nr:hypothetical protein DMB37_01845 [Nocardia sp. CS682]
MKPKRAAVSNPPELVDRLRRPLPERRPQFDRPHLDRRPLRTVPTRSRRRYLFALRKKLMVTSFLHRP